MDVFISYSRKDRSIDGDGCDIIATIQQQLNNNGISYWLDEEGIYSGDTFASVISKNIAESKIFLFISSKNSNASRWTCGEIATASSYDKRIIPFKIDQTPYDPSITIYLAALDTIDYTANPEKAIQRLIISVMNYLKELKTEALKKDAETKLEKEKERIRLEREKILAEREKEISQIAEEQFETEAKIRVLDTRIDNLLREKHLLLEELALVKAQITKLRDEDSIPMVIT